MAPVLAHGLSFGPFDILTKHGLTQEHGTVVHNSRISDQIALFIPWTNLAWTQVHHGQLPLWNPYSLLGMPLAFNWESAPFGIPALVGYLVPLHLAYTVGILTTLVIAGTGVYVLARVLGLSILGCAMAATVFELSGRFISTLGWSLASVMSWSGWLFAIAILLVRGRHRVRDIALFAVVLAFTFYAGYPEGVILLVASLAVFVVALLAARVRAAHPGPILRPAGDLLMATVAGCALAAPLAIPGFQVVAGSNRNGQLGIDDQTIGWHNLLNVVVDGFDGLPWHGSAYFGGAHTVASWMYLGVIAVVLALVAVAIRWRHPEVLSFAVVAIVTVGLVFVGPLASAFDRIPDVGSVRFYDALGPLSMAVAVLAGIGTDAIVRSPARRAVQYWAGGGFAVAAIFLLALWTGGRGHLDPIDMAIRGRSFLWPAIETAVGLAVVGVLVAERRRNRPDPVIGGWLTLGRGAALVLIACETASLVVAGAPTFSSNSTYLTPTPAVLALQQAVGSSIVGLGSSCRPTQSLGILVNVNIAYQVQEFGVYDPVVPYDYVSSWQSVAGRPPSNRSHRPHNTFCPAVTNATKARQYGIAFVLEARGSPGPQGAVFDERVGNEDLYRIPHAAAATITPVLPSGRFPKATAPGMPVAVSHPDPASWRLTIRASRPQVLRLRLTNLPGWHATIDGRPLRLDAFTGVMLQARIPPGHHVVDLHYWPDAFNVGLVLAICSAAVLSVAVLLAVWRRRPTGAGERAAERQR